MNHEQVVAGSRHPMGERFAADRRELRQAGLSRMELVGVCLARQAGPTRTAMVTESGSGWLAGWLPLRMNPQKRSRAGGRKRNTHAHLFLVHTLFVRASLGCFGPATGTGSVISMPCLSGGLACLLGWAGLATITSAASSAAEPMTVCDCGVAWPLPSLGHHSRDDQDQDQDQGQAYIYE